MRISAWRLLTPERLDLVAPRVVPQSLAARKVDFDAIFVAARVVGLRIFPVGEDDARLVGRPDELALVADVVRPDPGETVGTVS